MLAGVDVPCSFFYDHRSNSRLLYETDSLKGFYSLMVHAYHGDLQLEARKQSVR